MYISYRSQYLHRVVSAQGETAALLANHTQRNRQRVRETALKLVARRIFYAVHTIPIRKAFAKWMTYAQAGKCQFILYITS